MADIGDTSLLRYCEKAKIPVKRYPNCFKKKKINYKKMFPASRKPIGKNIIYDYSTETEGSDTDDDEYLEARKKKGANETK